jgi:hypothetical protein
MTFEKERERGVSCKNTSCEAFNKKAVHNCWAVHKPTMPRHPNSCEDYIPNEVTEVKECLTSFLL